MSLLLIEGFEAFDNGDNAAPSGMDSAYAVDTNSGFTIQPGRISGKSIRFATNIESSRFITTPNLGNQGTLVVGFAFYNPTPGAGADRMLVAMRDGSTLGLNLRLLTSGEYQVRLGTSVLATTSGAATLDAWHYLELKCVCHGSAGSYELRKGGVNILSDSGLDTQAGSNAFHDLVRFHSAVSLGLIDDVYIDDSTFRGDHKVVTIFPDAAGDDADFTPSSGSNFQAVDEKPHDGDTSYVESSTTDHQDLYGVPVPSNIGTIAGVQHNIVCRKTDSTNFDIKPVCKSGSTESVGSAQTVDSTTYTTKRRMLENDPDTAAPWASGTAIGSAQFGYRVG